MSHLQPDQFSRQAWSFARWDGMRHDPELCRTVREEAAGALQQPTVRRFAKGTQVVVQGDAPTFLGVLRRGYVRQERLRLDGDHVLFGLACPGDIVGGLPWIAATYASEAATDVEVCIFDHATVETLMLESPRFRETYLRETQRQYHRLLSSAWHRNALDSRERIMAFLVDATGFMRTEPLPDGSLILTNEVSRRDWADLTNTAVETISRTMRYLEEKDIVTSLTPFRFRIWDLDRLAFLAGIDPPRRTGASSDTKKHRNNHFASPKSARRMTSVNALRNNAYRVGNTQSFMTTRERGEGKGKLRHVEEEIRN